MEKKTSGINKKWIQTKAFYAVAVSLILVIAGIATVIYNVSTIKGYIAKTPDDSTTAYSVENTTTDSRANANQTGIEDNRDTTTMPRTTANDLNRPYTGYYLLPLNSSVTKDYSDDNMVYSKTMGDWRVHDGIDVGGNNADNVIAIQDGKVKAVYHDVLWGDVIEIEHGNGLSAKYCGVKSELTNDSKIEQGQVIGTVVEIPIESKDGMHVHLETYVKGGTVNPVVAMNLFAGNSEKSEE